MYGLGRLLALTDQAWFEANEPRITRAIAAMRRRDLDGDGLIESRLRQGVSGEHQWSTTWADVVSMGWKDGWSNAILHGALRHLATGLRRFSRPDAAAELDDWADRLRASGLLEPERARRAMEALWAEFKKVGYTDLANGIPINLHPIGEQDLGGVVFGLPIGGYLQGGATHHRTGGFLRALYAVGMTAEGDTALEALASTTADDSVFGGIGSGLDWRLWDATPSGYEGLLAEGFGFLAVALERWGADTPG